MSVGIDLDSTFMGVLAVLLGLAIILYAPYWTWVIDVTKTSGDTYNSLVTLISGVGTIVMAWGIKTLVSSR